MRVLIVLILITLFKLSFGQCGPGTHLQEAIAGKNLLIPYYNANGLVIPVKTESGFSLYEIDQDNLSSLSPNIKYIQAIANGWVVVEDGQLRIVKLDGTNPFLVDSMLSNGFDAYGNFVYERGGDFYVFKSSTGEDKMLNTKKTSKYNLVVLPNADFVALQDAISGKIKLIKISDGTGTEFNDFQSYKTGVLLLEKSDGLYVLDATGVNRVPDAAQFKLSSITDVACATCLWGKFIVKENGNFSYVNIGSAVNKTPFGANSIPPSFEDEFYFVQAPAAKCSLVVYNKPGVELEKLQSLQNFEPVCKSYYAFKEGTAYRLRTLEYDDKSAHFNQVKIGGITKYRSINDTLLYVERTEQNSADPVPYIVRLAGTTAEKHALNSTIAGDDAIAVIGPDMFVTQTKNGETTIYKCHFGKKNTACIRAAQYSCIYPFKKYGTTPGCFFSVALTDDYKQVLLFAETGVDKINAIPLNPLPNASNKQ